MSSIDRVLQDAVAAGSVPQVVAVAVGRDGLGRPRCGITGAIYFEAAIYASR